MLRVVVVCVCVGLCVGVSAELFSLFFCRFSDLRPSLARDVFSPPNTQQ
jgi:hypothetical protein